MSKEYQKHGAKQHKGGSKKKVGNKPGPGAVKDIMNSSGMGAGSQMVQNQIGGAPYGGGQG